jgi:hypothetical protein
MIAFKTMTVPLSRHRLTNYYGVGPKLSTNQSAASVGPQTFFPLFSAGLRELCRAASGLTPIQCD